MIDVPAPRVRESKVTQVEVVILVQLHFHSLSVTSRVSRFRPMSSYITFVFFLYQHCPHRKVMCSGFSGYRLLGTVYVISGEGQRVSCLLVPSVKISPIVLIPVFLMSSFSCALLFLPKFIAFSGKSNDVHC